MIQKKRASLNLKKEPLKEPNGNCSVEITITDMKVYCIYSKIIFKMAEKESSSLKNKEKKTEENEQNLSDL